MKTKRNDWVNRETLEVSYGFDVWVGGRWEHAAENGEPCLFKTKTERDAKQAEFRKHIAT